MAADVSAAAGLIEGPLKGQCVRRHVRRSTVGGGRRTPPERTLSLDQGEAQVGDLSVMYAILHLCAVVCHFESQNDQIP